MHSSHEGLGKEDLVLVCKHITGPEVWDDELEVNLVGGTAPIIACNACRDAMVDAQEGRISQEEAQKDLQPFCRECALELVTRKWLPLRPGVEGLALSQASLKVIEERNPACRVCGSGDVKVFARTFVRSMGSLVTDYQCRNCGSYFRAGAWMKKRFPRAAVLGAVQMAREGSTASEVAGWVETFTGFPISPFTVCLWVQELAPDVDYADQIAESKRSYRLAHKDQIAESQRSYYLARAASRSSRSR